MTAALSEATASDLAWWRAFAELEPFGPLQDSRRAGWVATAALAPWSKKGDAPKPEDFFPELREGRAAGPMEPEEMMLKLQAHAAACANMRA